MAFLHSSCLTNILRRQEDPSLEQSDIVLELIKEELGEKDL